MKLVPLPDPAGADRAVEHRDRLHRYPPDAYETAALKQYVVDFPPAAVARDQLEFATAELSTYQTGRVRKLLDDAIQAVLTDQKSVEDALGSAQKQADRLLKRYR